MRLWFYDCIQKTQPSIIDDDRVDRPFFQLFYNPLSNTRSAQPIYR